MFVGHYWVLDLIVHGADLPLYGNSLKIGLGLWNYPVAAFALELALLFGGMYLYFRSTEATTTGGRYGMIAYGLLMACVQMFVFFGPPPSSDRAAAVTALTLYVLFAVAAHWLEKKRSASRARKLEIREDHAARKQTITG